MQRHTQNFQQITNMSFKFIIYETEEAGLVKAEQEGQAQNLPYWQDSENVTKYVSTPIVTSDSKWALDVTEYTTLTDEEETQVVNTINIPE